MTEPTTMLRNQRRGRAGLTLIEMLVSVTLLGIIMGTVTGMIARTQTDYGRQREVIRLQENVRMAELTLTRLLRTAAVDPLAKNIAGVDIDPLAHGAFDNIRVRSDFNPADGDIADPMEDALVYVSADTLYVRWRAGTPPQAAAYPVRSLLFEYFAADNTPITTPALIPSAAKVKYTITAPIKPGDATLKRRVSWVHFRN